MHAELTQTSFNPWRKQGLMKDAFANRTNPISTRPYAPDKYVCICPFDLVRSGWFSSRLNWSGCDPSVDQRVISQGTNLATMWACVGQYGSMAIFPERVNKHKTCISLTYCQSPEFNSQCGSMLHWFMAECSITKITTVRWMSYLSVHTASLLQFLFHL